MWCPARQVGLLHELLNSLSLSLLPQCGVRVCVCFPRPSPFLVFNFSSRSRAPVPYQSQSRRRRARRVRIAGCGPGHGQSRAGVDWSICGERRDLSLALATGRGSPLDGGVPSGTPPAWLLVTFSHFSHFSLIAYFLRLRPAACVVRLGEGACGL